MGFPDGYVRPFFSDSQMKNLRMVARSGFATVVTIQRRTTSDSAYGDGDDVTWSTIERTKGWLHSTPTPVQEADTGSIITVNTYRLFLPVGTNVKAGDQALIGPDTYVVSDTTAESTWQAMMTCSLRKRE